jgi:hypothetical protein
MHQINVVAAQEECKQGAVVLLKDTAFELLAWHVQGWGYLKLYQVPCRKIQVDAELVSEATCCSRPPLVLQLGGPLAH